MCSAEEFINDWIGVRHIYNGRDRNGIDCYGLVVLYYKEVLNQTLPDWHCEDESKIWVARFMDERVKELMEVIDKPIDHCIAVVKRKSIANHIGVVYKGNLFHCLEKSSVVFQPLWAAQCVFGNLKFGVPNAFASTQE